MKITDTFEDWFKKEYASVLKKEQQYKDEYQITGASSTQKTALRYEYLSKVFALAESSYAEQSKEYEHYYKQLRKFQNEIGQINVQDVGEYKDTIENILLKYIWD